MHIVIENFLPTRKFFKVCLAICMSAPGLLQAQSGNFIQSDYYSNQIPKTPEGAFGTFGGIPINAYTGLPEISFTLMTLTSRDLSVPVVVSYDATGIRTDELSSEVGMKWNMQAGGFVVREMNGLPDDDPNKGIWKYVTSNNYFENVNNPRDWVSWTERGDRDARPDEFTAVFNGRSVRFVINKYRQVITIPRSNVGINCEVLNNKINKFTITAEDGTQYVFGGVTSAIEERKIENLSVRTKIGYGEFQAEQMLPEASETERAIDFFNTKWYLVSIKSVTGDQINFSYLKGSDCKYVTKTSTHKMKAVQVQVFEKDPDVNLGFTSRKTALRKFSTTSPGRLPQLESALPDEGVPSTDEANYFDPDKFPVNAGGLFSNVALVTSKIVRLSSIQALTGARINFSASLKDDLPNAYKYDKIELFNLENTVLKSIRFKYETVNASTASDYTTAPESIMATKIASLPANQSYWAYQFQSYPESAVSDSRYRKYVYEGLKPYNYKRHFLASIADATSGNDLTLYAFSYKTPNLLRRRTTPLASKYGYHQTKGTQETGIIKTDTYTRMTNVLVPNASMTSVGQATTGMLESITYPTGGRTVFSYDDLAGYPSLSAVVDVDQEGTVLAQKEVEYLDTSPSYTPVYVSYQEYKLDGSADWLKYRIQSSSPQNPTTLSKGSIACHGLTRIYHGSKKSNTGWEEFSYSSAASSVDERLDSRLVNSIIFADPYDVTMSGVQIPQGLTYETFPFPPPVDNDHLRGLLLKQQTFDAGGLLVGTTVHLYELNPGGYKPTALYGFHGGSFVWTSKTKATFEYGYVNSPQYRCRYSTLKMQSDWIVLSKTIQTTHDQSDPAITTSMVAEYTYDPVHMQVVQTKNYNAAHPALSTTTVSKFATHSDYDPINETSCDTEYEQCMSSCSNERDEYVRSYCYSDCQYRSEACLSNPPSSASAETVALHHMRTQHQVGVPVETQVIVDEGSQRTLVGAVVYKFQKYKNDASTFFVKPREVWSMKVATIPAGYTTSRVDDAGKFLLDNNWLRKVHTFDNYDATTGNILQQTTLDGVVSSYQWSYNGALATGFTINPGSYAYQYNYAYKPGVGLTSTTDPNGIKNYYEYDPDNRLRLTRDHDQNILTRERYHYAAEKSAVPESSFAICADGPVKIDISDTVAPVAGACASNDGGAGTYLKVSVSNGCGPFTYTWEYQTGDNKWAALGTGLTTSVPAGFANRVVGTYTVRCILTDNCGKSMISPTVLLAIFNSQNP